ncbi:MAG TPA: dTDP-4-dehydrorhamnose reductase [Ilumatobacteraceae bacterium]|nr:dTDP-4-dehydrorhamnose reductase [Ilumatobacteraceae bacterium]
MSRARRVLVTGAAGQVGREVVDHWAAQGDEVIGVGRGQVDVTDRDSVLGAVTSTDPDVIVHCAAWTAVDDCEADERKAMLTNALPVRWLTDAAQRSGAFLITLSTDYVFDGTLDRAYHEWDTPNPASVYGRSKLAGEHEAASLGPQAAIVRTSWVCGFHGTNMVKTILRLADQHPALSFVDDQRGHPTFAADLAIQLRRISAQRLGGVIHATNQGAATWYEFARAVVAAAGKDPAMVRPISTAELQPRRPAPRPANSVLENAVLAAAGVALMSDFHQPLTDLVQRLQRG